MSKWHLVLRGELPPPNLPVLVITVRKTLTTAIYTGKDDVWHYPIDADDMENLQNYEIHRAAPDLWIRLPGISNTEMVEFALNAYNIVLDDEVDDA